MSRLDQEIPPVNIPEGKMGSAQIVHFEVTEDAAKMHNLRESMHRGGRYISPGTYTKLIAGGALQMSDVPAEKMDHWTAVRQAKGDCLITGLGIGMVASAMARKPEVNSVTVIEIDADVIALVAPHLDPKITVICADALTWPLPVGKKWDVIWHDIWPHICADNAETMTKLKRRYARRKTAWMGAWVEADVARLKRDDGRYRSRW